MFTYRDGYDKKGNYSSSSTNTKNKKICRFHLKISNAIPSKLRIESIRGLSWFNSDFLLTLFQGHKGVEKLQKGNSSSIHQAESGLFY